MKKIFSLFFAGVGVCAMLTSTSCKKTQHPTNPTPANYRVYSISKLKNNVQPAEVYTFTYDAKNRVVQIIYSTNDTGTVKHGTGVGLRTVFSYSNDSVSKIVTVLQTGAPVEKDIFIRNSAGQLITAYFPTHSTQFEYYGKLLSRVTDKYYKNDTSVATTVEISRSYTTDNSDFLAWALSTSLVASFPKADAAPFTVHWNTDLGLKTVTHTANGYTDKLDNYDRVGLTMDFTDNVGHTDTVSFPGGYRLYENYGVFPDKANRPGDFMNIASLIMYGMSIYSQDHLTKSVTNTGSITNITYDIDADSKIKTTSAYIMDSLGASSTESYRFQYETF